MIRHGHHWPTGTEQAEQRTRHHRGGDQNGNSGRHVGREHTIKNQGREADTGDQGNDTRDEARKQNRRYALGIEFPR
jgi:hypothetical protein